VIELQTTQRVPNWSPTDWSRPSAKPSSPPRRSPTQPGSASTNWPTTTTPPSPSSRTASASGSEPSWTTTKLSEYFDEVVVSYDVGGHKVDGAPYDEIRDRLDADEYVMVGDDYESDVEGARAAGFVPIHYENDDDGPELFATLRAML